MIEVWQQLVHNYPILQIVFDALAIIVPLASLLAYCGLYFISAIAKMISIAKKRNSYEKCSKQIAFLALIIGWILLVCARIWLYYNQPYQAPDSLISYLREMSWLLLSLGVMLGTIYYFIWRVLKNMPVLHVTVGMLAAVQNCVALVCILFTIRISSAVQHPAGQEYALPNIFPEVWEAPIWSAACYTIPAIFGLGAAYSLCWLLLRRKKDDFGRDYYNVMLKWCSAWAKNSWFILILLLSIATALKVWRASPLEGKMLQQFIYEACGLLLWLLPALFWLIVQRSALPLRNRWLIYLALPLAMSFMLPYFIDITFV